MEGLDFSHVNMTIITGSTNAANDTAMTTKPLNPLHRKDVWCLMLSGAGVYIEDDGSDTVDISGITATDIDVRSTVNASEPFKIAVIPRPKRVITGTWGGSA